MQTTEYIKINYLSLLGILYWLTVAYKVVKMLT